MTRLFLYPLLVGAVACDTNYQVRGQLVGVGGLEVGDRLLRAWTGVEDDFIKTDEEGRFELALPYGEVTRGSLEMVDFPTPPLELLGIWSARFEAHPPSSESVVELPPIVLWPPAARWFEQPDGVLVQWNGAPPEVGAIDSTVEIVWDDVSPRFVLAIEETADAEVLIEEWMREDKPARATLGLTWADELEGYTHVEYRTVFQLPESLVVPLSRGQPCQVREEAGKAWEDLDPCPATDGNFGEWLGPFSDLTIDLGRVEEVRRVVIRARPELSYEEAAVIAVSLDGDTWEVVDELTLSYDGAYTRVQVRELARPVDARFVRVSMVGADEDDTPSRAAVVGVSVF